MLDRITKSGAAMGRAGTDFMLVDGNAPRG